MKTELTPRAEVDALIKALRAGSKSLNDASTRRFVCDGPTTVEIISAADGNPHTTRLGWAGHTTEKFALNFATSKTVAIEGQVDGGVVVNQELGALLILGDVRGHVVLQQGVRREVRVTGDVSGNVTVSSSAGDVRITGSVGGSVKLNCHIADSINVTGDVAGSVLVRSGSVVEGDLRVGGRVGDSVTIRGSIRGAVLVRASVDRNVIVEGPVGRRIHLSNLSSIAGYLEIGGEVGAERQRVGEQRIAVELAGTVAGSVRLGCDVKGSVAISGQIGGSVALVGSAKSERDGSPALSVSGGIDRNLAIRGSFDGPASFRVRVGGSCWMTPSSDLEVISLRCAFEGPAQIGEGVHLDRCNFDGLAGFGNLTFTGSNIFGKANGRQTICANPGSRQLEPGELSNLYRQFRRSFEAGGDRPGAADFYFGECEFRRKSLEVDSSRAASTERAILTAYRYLSAYGTRASFALTWFMVSAALGSLLFVMGGFSLPDGTKVTFGGADSFRGTEVLLFSLQSMVSFFRPPETHLSTAEGYLQVTLRFLGPALIAQAVLAIRERIIR